ncbi:hypothetical protein GCM10009665_24140 [Kitasatospora nipponensis]|uniref:Uncharacterized protein n=1 Tax=Kitasatospora nipponensis TaxID=258049 RepID=A0ABN1W2T0_9ACTN
MAPSDHPHGSARWYLERKADITAQQMLERQQGHEVLITTTIVGRPPTEHTERRAGLSDRRRSEFTAAFWAAWHTRVDYGLANGEFKVPTATRWETVLYGTGTGAGAGTIASSFGSRAPLHILAVWLPTIVAGLIAWPIAGEAVALFTALVTLLLAALVLQKVRLAGTAFIALAASAGYLFGPHRFVTHPSSHLGGFVEVDAVNVHTHWLGACLFLAAALVLACLRSLITDPGSMLPPRLTAKRFTVTVTSLLLSAVAFFAVGPFAVIVFLICWPTLYGLVSVVVLVAGGLFESVSARPPVVAREKAYLYRLRNTIDYEHA